MQKSILIVEDSKTILEVLSFSLDKHGYAVFSATNGEKALEYLDGRQIDLMITDLYMPKMDGLELVRVTRKIDAYKKIPILFLTTEAQQHKKIEAKKAGATGWVIKPFVPEKLIRAIKKLLE